MKIAKAMLDAHIPFIEKAGGAGVQVLSFQEVFNQPYFFRPRRDSKRHAAAETIPDGPTIKLMDNSQIGTQWSLSFPFTRRR